MPNLQKSLDRFKARTQEIENQFEGLREKKAQLEKEIDEVKQDQNNSPVSVSRLFSNSLRGSKGKFYDLKEELEAINGFIETTNSMGGLSAVYKTDEQLEKLAVNLLSDIQTEVKNAVKFREGIEKRYENIISEIETAAEEQNQLNDKVQQFKGLLMIIEQRTNLKTDINLTDLNFDHNKIAAYRALGRAKQDYKNAMIRIGSPVYSGH